MIGKHERLIVFATSNSWRRFELEFGGGFCTPTNQRDGHPDLAIDECDGMRMAAAWNACAGSPVEKMQVGQVAKMVAALTRAREAWAVVRSYCVAGPIMKHEPTCDANHGVEYDCDCGVPELDAALAGLDEGEKR